MNKYKVKIERVLGLQKSTLTFKLSCSQNIQKYLISNTLYVQYDKNIDKVPESILYIPAISGIVMPAWHIGADVYVEEIDATYLESLEKIKTVMKGWYPKLPFSEIYAEKIVSNRFSNKGYGMLFSGGIDSMATYIRHRNKRPHLIHIVIGEGYPKTHEEQLISFANQEGVPINTIKTNIAHVIHERLLTAQFGVDWWGNIVHGILFTSLSAPLTVENHIRTLLRASTHTREFKYPWGSHPLIDNNTSWADINVIHDDYESSRQQKIRRISKSDSNISNGLLLISDSCSGSALQASGVCGKCEACLNSNCEKCLRDIAGLVLENVDPNELGFNVDNGTFDFIKQSFIKGSLYKKKLLTQTNGEVFGHESVLFFWKDIQKHIPETMDHNLYNSKEFFEYFKNLDITEYKENIKISQLPGLLAATIAFHLYPLYCSLPMNIQNASLFKKMIEFVYKKIS